MDAGPLLSTLLTVDYPNKPAVIRDVELQVQSGEVLGLVGESGFREEHSGPGDSQTPRLEARCCPRQDLVSRP